MSKINFVMFIVGAAIGSVATWVYLKKHYEQIAQEEIDSVKAVFANRKSDINTKNKENDNKFKNVDRNLQPDLVGYAAKLQEHGYTNYSANSEKNNEKRKDDSMLDKPYIISPEEYGEITDYENISLTYYSDGILADDYDEIVDDIETTVGSDFADHFGDYEDDSVFVRNDRLRCDYEILKDYRPYSAIVNPRRHK
ncbi:MAG: hypothetical protein K2H01_06010 [Ruminococcus sp.]|nr:hypothetical protein [Ruminococcus sp.]